MSRWRVVSISCDDGAFGYWAPPFETVVKDYLTKSEAKAIMRHYYKRQMEEAMKGNTAWLDYTSYEVEVLNDEGSWINVSQGWGWDGSALKEQWFEDMGWNYMAWMQNSKETPYNFKNI